MDFAVLGAAAQSQFNSAPLSRLIRLLCPFSRASGAKFRLSLFRLKDEMQECTVEGGQRSLSPARPLRLNPGSWMLYATD
jgi:hypothetical protein